MRTILFRICIAAIALFVMVVVALIIFLLFYPENTSYYVIPGARENLFKIQSIDTMKYSRDIAGQVLNNPHSFTPMIDRQMALIAEAGATHAAIATPYDAEFLPVLRLWVASARAHNLSVWFRGNFSGWEGWFEYARIDRSRHTQLLKEFLRNNPALFQSGDVFSPCPECENGGPGDPRQTGDESGFNSFLIKEKKIAADEFARQNTYIAVYPSMNADIAREIITPETVRAFDGTILIDHYVRTPEQFAHDIKAIPQQLHATIGLGEFGAPISDLNGSMTETQQATYIDSLFSAMYSERAHISIVNYWTLRGGSTALINNNGTPRAAYFTVQNYFKAFNAYGAVYNSLGESVGGARVSIDNTDYEAIADGAYQIFVPRQYRAITILADGYTPITLRMPASATTTIVRHDVYLEPITPDWWYRMRAALYKKLKLQATMVVF
jgi:hypothetical protein